MIITFCGHSDFRATQELEARMLACIKEQAKDEPISFFLGGYGQFDSFALHCCKKYKESNPNAEILFISPYRREHYFKNREFIKESYDGILIPDGISDVFTTFNIIKRNKWMVEKADFVIGYINVGWGGAAKMMEYAIKLKKPFLNIGEKKYE